MSSILNLIKIGLIVILGPIACVAVIWATFFSPEMETQEEREQRLKFKEYDRQIELLRRSEELRRQTRPNPRQERSLGPPLYKEGELAPESTDPKFAPRTLPGDPGFKMVVTPNGDITVKGKSPEAEAYPVVDELIPVVIQELESKRDILVSEEVTEVPENLTEELLVDSHQRMHHRKILKDQKISWVAWCALKNRQVILNLGTKDGDPKVVVLSVTSSSK